MLLIHLYSNLIGACEERNGKPRSLSDRKAGYEIHHITARSQGGTNHAYNLVYLTPREHYTAHHILARVYGGGLAFAFWRMSNGKKGKTGENTKATARQYATAKELVSQILRAQAKEGKSLSSRMAGKKRGPMSAKHKATLSKALIGHKKGPQSAEHKEKRAQALRGRPLSPERIENLKRALANQPRKECPHCGRSFTPGPFKQHHGDNCKQRLIDICTTDPE
ncbi:HNH endonuclease [Salmonella enterica]|nr:HNH endonuclease [Salmonella enterica]ELM2684161.1 HNH endonuclease [Salmonella enterica]